MNGAHVATILPKKFLRAQRCENCKFLGPPAPGRQQPTCRHDPPRSQLITGIVEGQNGREPHVLGSVTYWPEVPLEEFCYQWAQRIVTAQSLDQATAAAAAAV